jgi:superfamily I DNA and/or RNA helicase
MAASATISILKANDSDLFYDWPIDLVIIDEISKSTIPEIIGRILLAKKVVFAGDYKQLPPMSEYNLDECKQLVADADFNRRFTR